MIDLVKKLREGDAGWNNAAADRIEKLEAALFRIAMPNHKIAYCADGHEENVLLARATLKDM